MSSDNLVPEPQASIFDVVSRNVGDERAAARMIAHPNFAVLTCGSSARRLFAHAQKLTQEHQQAPTPAQAQAQPQSQSSVQSLAHSTAQSSEQSSAQPLAQSSAQPSTTSQYSQPHDATGAKLDYDQDKDQSTTRLVEQTMINDDAPIDDDASAITLLAIDEIGRATARDVRQALHEVIDPELGIDVIDLGLVYGIEIDEFGRAIITMTLTTPACPLTDLIEDECASVLAGLVEEFRIDWTWNPRWTVDCITDEGRDQLAALGFNLDSLPKY